jgi:uncharacterized protein GlcG (DUF336 family)
MNRRLLFVCCLAATLIAACSGGASGQSSVGTGNTSGCAGQCASSALRLTATDVGQIISQGIAEAKVHGVNATIAVVDRVGNVLGVYRMGSAATRSVLIASTVDASGNAAIHGGLEGIRLSAAAMLNIDDQAAIAKAITGAYLSSEGNAFSTRTASQIIQQHFDPPELNQASGPLYGVQFSQLACSDFMQSSTGSGSSTGPQRSPLGLSADPGGFPLYKGGTVVGGVGVLADGLYSIDGSFLSESQSIDELIAEAASYQFAAPVDRRADRITVNGRSLRFSNANPANLSTNPATAPPFASLDPSLGSLIAVRGYNDGTLHDGTAFGDPNSGIRSDGDVNFPGRDAFVFVDQAGTQRFPPRNATDSSITGSSALNAGEVLAILHSAIDVANRARGQIRQPSGSPARVTVAVVDTQGMILGMVRSRDAPVFGADVSVQKARSATFFSNSAAGGLLAALPDAKYLTTTNTPPTLTPSSIAAYVPATQAFLANATALEDGAVAFSARAIGDLARPFYPDGIDGRPPGPLSKAAGHGSIFSTGLQLDLSNNAILQHVLYVTGIVSADVAPGCAGVSLSFTPLSAVQTSSDLRLGNGLQIFPGGVPIYRGGTLVGGVGVSGDGVDQDDMVAFLGLNNAGLALRSGIGNAPAARRADTLAPNGVRLRYVQCPQAPFVDSNEQHACDAL